MAPLAANQIDILRIVAHAYNAPDSYPPVRGKEWFIKPLHAAFEKLVANGLIEPVIQYRITDAGRAALQEHKP